MNDFGMPQQRWGPPPQGRPGMAGGDIGARLAALEERVAMLEALLMQGVGAMGGGPPGGGMEYAPEMGMGMAGPPPGRWGT